MSASRTRLAWPLAAGCILTLSLWLPAAAQQSAKKSTAKKSAAKKAPVKSSKSKTTAVRRTRRPKPVSAAVREASVNKVQDSLASPYAFENPAGLVAFFERLFRMKEENPAVHVLHYGDSHTASDDWPGTLRTAFQIRFGDGGPGFVPAGRPYSGFRRYDVTLASSRWWTAEGTMRNRGDGLHGLSGISLTTRRKGESTTVGATGERAELLYLQQPDGGPLEVWVDGILEGEVPTEGELGPARAPISIIPGERRFQFRTRSNAPVRLFGLAIDNPTGVTWETLGINGATAAVLNGWDERILASHLAQRDPALILVAYGANEANSRRWEAAAYEAALRGIVERFRKLAPAASILLAGPPDGRVRNPSALTRIIEIQRALALDLNCAFWDWRARMGGPGSVRTWLNAGMANWDQIHFTRAGYQLVGRALFADLMHQYDAFLKIRTEPSHVETKQNQ